MGYGKGAIPIRNVEKILKKNGYRYVRDNGHRIYKNEKGNIIAIPMSCCTYLIMRVFKENGIKY